MVTNEQILSISYVNLRSLNVGVRARPLRTSFPVGLHAFGPATIDFESLKSPKSQTGQYLSDRILYSVSVKFGSEDD